jgi:hypothetical protein
MTTAIHITPPNNWEVVTLDTYEDYRDRVGGFIEIVRLVSPEGVRGVLYVDEEYWLKVDDERYTQYDVNLLATLLAGLNGRPDLVVGIYGAAVLVGDTDEDGDDTDVDPYWIDVCARAGNQVVTP